MIKQPWLAAVSAVCLLVAIGFAIERSIFLLSAERTPGTISSIDSRNDTCGAKKRRYACTKFTASVRYRVGPDVNPSITVSAGSSQGSNQPVTNASRRVGETVRVVYSPSTPTKAYEDTFFGVWGAPVIAFGAQIATMLGSLSEGRRGRRG